MILVMEAWIVSIFGWVWLTLQDAWMPSLLSSFVYYGFLLLTTCHLIICAFLPDAHAPRIAYFNVVAALCMFCGGCIADTFHTGVIGTPPTPPANVSWKCCTNCDIARYHRDLFFSDTPLYLVEVGILIGYLLVHLLIAGAQMLGDKTIRSIWGGGAWSIAFAMFLACRFTILFNSQTNNLVPDTIFYLLIFSQPLLSFSVLYWLVLCVFLILLICDGIPTMNIIGVRVVRSVTFGVVGGFVVITVYELWVGGMLTPSITVSLTVLLLGSGLAMLESYVGRTYSSLPPSDYPDTNGYYPYNARRVATGVRGVAHARDSVVVPVTHGGTPVQRLTRDIIPVPIQMQAGKKGV